jgi:hypothetical protein
MAQLQGSHRGFEYDAFWNIQEQTLFWGAVISQEGNVVGRPKGQLKVEAYDGEASDTIRDVVISAIDKGVGVNSDEHPKLGVAGH